MAIQAQMYPENLGLPISCQDWLFMGHNNSNNNTNNNNFCNNNNMFVNGCGVNEFSYNNLQQKLQQQQQLQYQQQQEDLLQQQYMLQIMQQQRNTSVNNNGNGFLFVTPTKKQKLATTAATTTATTTASTVTSESGDNHMSVNISQSLSAQLEKQRLEIDRYISMQNERLRLALQEQRKQQVTALMNRLEERAMKLLRQKDDEFADATRKTVELQEIMRKMEVEKQAWQRIATENESMAISLSNTLEQLKEQQQQACSSSSSNAVDDAESCCNLSDNNNKNRGKEVKCVAETGEKRNGSFCKVCNSRNSCMLLLPCRHLSSCKVCEAFLDACPVCKVAKMASIEALIS